MSLKSDAGTPLRNKSEREVIHVKTEEGVLPVSVKRRNIRVGRSTHRHTMIHNLELHPKVFKKGSKAR